MVTEKTINRTLYNRLEAQNKEAKLLKLNKLASNLENQLVKYNDCVRSDNENYVYSSEEVKEDIYDAIWDAVIRVADYLDYNIDAVKVQGTVERVTDSLLSQMCAYAGMRDGIGPHEKPVPGEITSKVVLDILEE